MRFVMERVEPVLQSFDGMLQLVRKTCGCSLRRRALFRRFRVWNEKYEQDVQPDRQYWRAIVIGHLHDGRNDERDAHNRRVDIEIRREAIGDTAHHRAFADLVEPLRLRLAW